MSESTPLEDRILELAGQARSVTVDGQQVNRRSLEELILADKYLASRSAARAGGSGLGIKFVTLNPQGGGG